jgi:nuclear GTP-binding protein
LKIALASGRLLKGGEPDLNMVARQILNDYQRGNIPHFVLPPGCEQRESTKTKTNGEEVPTTEEITMTTDDEVNEWSN